MKDEIIKRIEKIENQILTGVRLPELPVTKQILHAELGIGKSTLDRWITEGLPFRKVNGRIFLYRSEVSKWIKEMSNKK